MRWSGILLGAEEWLLLCRLLYDSQLSLDYLIINMSFKPGDIVWARRHPHPMWPAKIISRKKSNSNPTFEVQYFAEKSNMDVEEKDLFNFEEYEDAYMPTDATLKKNRRLGRAIEEVNQFIESRACKRSRKTKEPTKKLKTECEAEGKSNNFLKAMRQEELKIIEKSQEKRRNNNLGPQVFNPLLGNQKPKEQSKQVQKPSIQKLVKLLSEPKQMSAVRKSQLALESLFFQGAEVYTSPSQQVHVKQKISEAIDQLCSLKEANAIDFFNSTVCSLLNYFAGNLDVSTFQGEISEIKRWISIINEAALEHLNSTEVLQKVAAKCDITLESKSSQEMVEKGVVSILIIKTKNDVECCVQDKLKHLNLDPAVIQLLKEDIESYLTKGQFADFEFRWEKLKEQIEKLEDAESEKDIRSLLTDI